MHLSDGVLSVPVIVGTSLGAGALLAYGLKGTKNEEIPKISLMTAGFFALSMLSIPIGPSSVHPLMAGLMGIVLKRRSAVAIFVGLLLQAVLFGHGGLSALGANTLLVAVPAYLSYYLFNRFEAWRMPVAIGSGFIGAFAIFTCVALLSGLLVLSSERFLSGGFSVIHLLVLGHVPLMLIEGALTAFAVLFLKKVKSQILLEG